MLELGLQNEIKLYVTEENTASRLHSGALPVYATPAMIANMEACCAECVEPHMEKGCTTVGIRLDVSHDAATPIGEEITVRCKLVNIDRRKLTFEVTAFSRLEQIGHGTHERFIITADAFLSRLSEKYGR